MLGWLWRVLVGRFRVCDHVWETVETTKVIATPKAIPHAYDKHLRCTKCGNWKSVRL